MNKPLLSRREFLFCGTQFSLLAFPALAASPQQLPNTVDVVVVGSGGAGLCAAIEAAQIGASVLVVEKNASVGGNTAISTGFFNAVETGNPTDSVERHVSETLQVGSYLNDISLVEILCREAAAGLRWVRTLGVDYSSEPFLVYGAQTPRAYRPLCGSGAGLIEALFTRAVSLGVRIVTDTPMTELVADDRGSVQGIKVNHNGLNHTIRARRGVVLTTGGFSANAGLCAVCDPRLTGLGTTNQSGATGDGILCASQLGAFVSGMDYIQCIPGVQPGYRTRMALHVNLDSFLWLNLHGKRFIAEDGTRNTIRDAFLEQPKKMAYAVIDADGYSWFSPTVREQIEQGVKSGQVIRAQTLEELAKRLGIPAEAAIGTLDQFNQAVQKGYDADFGRLRLAKRIEKGPFYAAASVMSLHCTLGGLTVNDVSQVLDIDFKPISGLYAAGEVTAGLHGSDRLGGNGITEAVVFGRRAGRFAAGERR